MEMPLCEIADKLSILKLKSERLAENEEMKAALVEYEAAFENALAALQIDMRTEIRNAYWMLHQVNGLIWDFEAAIRAGRDLPLEEVGLRALMIRNLNRVRVYCKNQIVQHSGQGFKDVKVNYV